MNLARYSGPEEESVKRRWVSGGHRGLVVCPARYSRRHVRVWLLPLFACLLAPACGHLTSHVITDPTSAILRLRTDRDISAEVDLLAKPLIESGDNIGIVVGILTPDGATRCFGYGTIELQNDRAPAADTLFAVGSLTKCLVTSLLTVLADKGLLACDDTIGGILPSTVRLSDEVASVTLGDLAIHSTGLGRERASCRFFWSMVRYLFTGENLYGFFDQETAYDYLERAADSFDPEQPYCYPIRLALDAVLLTHEALQRANGDRVVEVRGTVNCYLSPRFSGTTLRLVTVKERSDRLLGRLLQGRRGSPVIEHVGTEIRAVRPDDCAEFVIHTDLPEDLRIRENRFEDGSSQER